MKTIFETFKKSVYNPTFYQSVASKPFSEGVRYYIKIVGFFTLFVSVVVGAILIPQGISFVKERAPHLVSTYYPKELSVNIEKGIATANVEMPYIVSLQSFDQATTTSPVKNMLVVDTTEEFSKSKFEEYKTYALLTRTDLVTRSEDGSITIKPLRTIPNVTISQDLLLSWVSNIQNYLWLISICVFLAAFIIIFCGYLIYLIPLLLFALVPKTIAYFKGAQLSYASAYKMSLYAIIPALALKTLFNIFGTFFLPEYFTLLVFMLVISINMQERKEATPTLFEKDN